MITPKPIPRLVCCLAAVLSGATAASAAIAPAESPSAQVDGIASEAAGVTSPWIIEQMPDGRIELGWGAIQRELAAPRGRVLASGGPTAAGQAATSVQCFVTVGDVVRSGSFLTSSLLTRCTSGFVYISAQSYFQYKQLLLWFRYSDTKGYGPSSSSPATWNQVVGCNVGRGNHQYRLRARAFSPAIGWSPWYSGRASATANCGTSAP